MTLFIDPTPHRIEPQINKLIFWCCVYIGHLRIIIIAQENTKSNQLKIFIIVLFTPFCWSKYITKNKN